MSKFSVVILKHNPTDIIASAATSNTGNHRSECTEELIELVFLSARDVDGQPQEWSLPTLLDYFSKVCTNQMLLIGIKPMVKYHFQTIMFPLAVTSTYLIISDAHFHLIKCRYSINHLRTK
jgi:hypothetical protein